MATIINEMPDDVEDLDEGMDVDLEIKEPEAKVKKETKPTQDELDFEIEEEDDTPKADRGRDPLPKEVVEELEQDELTDYSERVKQRMAQLKKVWHDERREKEAADRERQEAIKYAQQIAEENKRLKSTLSSGEETYVKTLQGAYESELAIAKRDYREAYDAGDTDRIIEAQAKMNDAQMKLSQASNYQRKHDISLQQPENTVPLRQETNTPQVPKPDARSGIDPSSEDYYRRIDETMQRRFPENFIGDDDSLEQDKPSQRKPSTVVAPATRSTAPKKVRLTKTQLAFAKKLKLTPEQYAREMIKLERTNG